MSLLSQLSFVGLAKETVLGTPVAATAYPPGFDLDFEDVIKPLRDESWRQNAAVLQGQYAGVKQSNAGWSGYPHVDSFGHLLRAILGPDTISGAGPYVHTMKQTVAQPPSYTLTDYRAGLDSRQHPGCMLEELTLKIDPQGMAQYDCKWQGWPSASASNPTPTFPTTAPLLGWQLTFSANSIASTRVVSTEMTFKRSVDVLFGSSGSQNPRETFAGDLEFTAKVTAFFENTTDISLFTGYTQAPTVWTLTSGASAILAVTSSVSSWRKAKVTRGDTYAKLEAEIDGIYSAADAGPVSAVLTNTQSTAY